MSGKLPHASSEPTPAAGPARLNRRIITGSAVAGALVLGAIIVPAVANASAGSTFAAGDLVVYRVGDGSTSLSDNAAPVFLDEYSPAGKLVQSIALPTSDSGSNHELTASGSAASEGEITLSADGRYLMAPGYHKSVGTDSVATTDDVTVARVGADGGVDTSTVLNEFADDNNVRGVASTDGTHIWVSGAAGGLGYTTLGSGGFTQLTDENLREVQVVGGQLYASSDKDDIGVSTVGTGTPTTSGQDLTNLPGDPESGDDPYNYVLLDLSGGTTPDTMYVSDDSAGKVYKFSLVSGKWKAEGSKSVSNVVDLTGSVVNGQAVLYATGSGSSGTSGTLSKVTDTAGAGATLSGSVTTLATAGSKEAFRGVAFAPNSGATSTPSASASTSASASPSASASASTSPSASASTSAGASASPSGSKTPTISLDGSTLLGSVGNTRNPAVTITVGDAYYGAAAVTLTAKSSSTSVVPTAGLVFSGSGATRTLAVTPAKAGYATLTVTATAPDGSTKTATVSYAASVADSADPAADYYSGIGNASAMIDVGGGYYVVGDDETNVLYLYQQGVTAPVKTYDFTSKFPNGDTEIDIEAAAKVGNRIYWTGSQSNKDNGDLAPSRSTVFATDISGSGASTSLSYVGAYTGLRTDMINWDAANGKTLGLAASAASGVGGHTTSSFNVEGLEFAPGSTSTAYFAFRAPLESTSSRSKALVVPVTNLDQLVTGAASKATFGSAIQMNLGGLGIRDIRKNAANQYVILGGTADGDNDAAALYSWDGVAADAPVKDAVTLPTPASTGAWEGIGTVPADLAAGSPLYLIQDDGDTPWYNDGDTSKDGLTAQYMKFLGDTITWK